MTLSLFKNRAAATTTIKRAQEEEEEAECMQMANGNKNVTTRSHKKN